MTGRTPRLGRPPTLSRDQIVLAAKDILEAAGLTGLSIRSLAAALGVSPMAIYRHVGNKEALLGLVLDEYSKSFPSTQLPAPPREQIVVLMTLVYDTVAGERWIAEVLQGSNRTGNGALWLVDRIIGAAVELGLDADRGALMHRALWNYTLGTLISLGRSDQNPDEVSAVTAKVHEIGGSALPHLTALMGDRVPHTSRADYLEGLAFLIDGYLTGGGTR